MIVLSWTPSEQISISRRLRFCAGVWSWDALTSSLKCKFCLLTFACRMKATWKLSSMCVAYLGLHNNARVLFDPTYPSVYMCTFINNDCNSMYGDVREIIPSDAPVSRGKEVDLPLFVDYNTGEKFTRLLRTGFVIYLNMAPIVWFSKNHPTLESSVFGAECVAMKNGIRNMPWPPLQVENDGCGLDWPHICIWGQHVCCPQHTSALVCLEEEVKLYLISCSTWVCCHGRVNHWACAFC
jgi:hypothetical protein